MGNRHRIWLLAVSFFIVGGIVWLALRSHESEPIYQGKTLSFWLQNYSLGNSPQTPPGGTAPPPWAETDRAIHQIGTNALPTLLRMLHQHDSKLKTEFLELARKQPFINIPPSASSDSQNHLSLRVLTALGPVAAPGVPQLIKILEQDPGAFPQQAVPIILGRIGPDARLAIPALLRGVAHTNEAARRNALFGLAGIHAEPGTVVPATIKCLHDPDIFVRAQAVRTLAAFGKDAHDAVPALLDLWRTEPRGTNAFATGHVHTADWSVGSDWPVTGLGSPRGIIPDINGLAGEAVQAIDPKAAADAGIKVGEGDGLGARTNEPRVPPSANR